MDKAEQSKTINDDVAGITLTRYLWLDIQHQNYMISKQYTQWKCFTKTDENIFANIIAMSPWT